jgi:hypothetical protein
LNALAKKQYDQAAVLQKKADDFSRVMLSLAARAMGALSVERSLAATWTED